MDSMVRRFFLHTFGCQMNVLDSELLAEELELLGYARVFSPRQADIILLNTCSVRRHAEDKVYSLLGRMKHQDARKPKRIIGVLGCMAQKDRALIMRRAPWVDLIVGPGRLALLPDLLEKAATGVRPCLEVSLDRTAAPLPAVAESFGCFLQRRHPPASPHPQAMVRIMFGCDKQCSYCVVPQVRGPEQSRPAKEIIEEVRRLADAGCMEVTLLGQTVNSYKDRSGPRTIVLADLLEKLSGLAGLKRLKFVTNHPRHMTKALLDAVRDLPIVCPYLHVPAQSGSDTVLRRMQRGYTAGWYREMLARIREIVPQAAVTSDFIVGFCGETEEDFEQTADLVRYARFKNSFIFKYSPRPGTAAEKLPDNVPETVKRRRNNQLLAIQNAISLEDNQAFVGRAVEILVEGPSKLGLKRVNERKQVQLVGRTACDRIVVFDGPPTLAGRLLKLRILRADALTLFGRREEDTSP